jgi:hypothetical protein
MSLYKSAQSLNINDLDDLNAGEDEIILYEHEPKMEDVVELHQPEETLEITFKLPTLPGSDADMPLEVSTDDVEVEEKGAKTEDKNEVAELEVVDPWKSPAPAQILNWVRERLQNLPRHSGTETTGIERTISAMKRINQEISKAIANDYNSEVDVAKLEEARREIFDGIHRLEDAKEKIEAQNYKRKKAVVENDGLVKEGKQDRIGGIIITVPILISRIAKTIINSTVSAGKDTEKTFDAQVKEWNLDKREQAELMELLDQMGFVQPRRDRGWARDHKADYTSEDNFDFQPNFSA